ncbi:CDGSH-type Zn-finger protein [Duganella sp. 1411]|uniref:hypothetical protein n=1 Tax=Duganella sp. 1411 TaxID=2806572 RepID=UPI001AE5D37D|nr:hypothetical protein [Duganella sp. 1411]MBP1208160.1 CDGSH-type Zn-finger protein [Duganella sp. 1411]
MQSIWLASSFGTSFSQGVLSGVLILHGSYGIPVGGAGTVAKRYLWQQIVTMAKAGRNRAMTSLGPKLCGFGAEMPDNCSVFNKYCAGTHIRVDLEGTTRYPNMRMGFEKDVESATASLDQRAVLSGQVLKLFTH